MEPEAQIFSERAEPFVESATLHESFDAKKAATKSKAATAAGNSKGTPPATPKKAAARR